MTRYGAFDPTPYRTHRRALAWLEPGERILEVGCGSGALTARIQAMGCTVVGVEERREAAERARPFCERVVTGDVEAMPLDLAPESFDAILFLNVLEHLVEPEATIRRLLPLLKPEGRVLVALPNVAHWSVRLRLLFGRFEYEDSGILDRTHLHFYTLRTARALLEEAGLRILVSDIVPDVPLLRFKPNLAKANYGVARLVPNLFATEALFVARPAREVERPVDGPRRGGRGGS